MFNAYGITRDGIEEGVVGRFFRRLGQSIKIKRFCLTKELQLVGNSVLFSNSVYELHKAYDLWKMGWIDYVVITSRDIFSDALGSTTGEIITTMEKRNAIIILDELHYC